MIEHKIKHASYQLNLHRSMGIKSQLSILEVARLMDVIRLGKSLQNNGQDFSHFDFSLN